MTELALLIESIAKIFACIAIIAGINEWKREFIGKRKIELAEETLSAFFEVKDAIAYIRNPFSNASEGKSRQRDKLETPDEEKLLDRGYTVFERYETNKDAFLKLNTVKYRFMAVFGKETADIFSLVNKTTNSIFSASNILSTHYWRRQGRAEMTDAEFKTHLEDMKAYEKIFWDFGGDTDEVKSKISSALTMLEKTTKPCFEKTEKRFFIF